MNIDIKQLDDEKIKYDWKTIYVGIKKGYFSERVISQYAMLLIENGNEEKSLFDLAYDKIDMNDANDVVDKVKMNNFPNLISADENIEIRKLRYIYLKRMEQNKTSSREIVEGIAEYYDSFDYPSDMNNLIYYMPIKPNEIGSNESIIEKFHQFLLNEKEYLTENKEN